MLRVRGIDHIVLLVADVERSVAWYQDCLGLEVEDLDRWRAGEAAFPSIRINDGTIIDIAEGDRSGSNLDHFCLVVEPTDLQALGDSGRFGPVTGPVPRSGARGEGLSLYVNDPDGNVIELKHYSS